MSTFKDTFGFAMMLAALMAVAMSIDAVLSGLSPEMWLAMCGIIFVVAVVVSILVEVVTSLFQVIVRYMRGTGTE